jgi:PmbA protein
MDLDRPEEIGLGAGKRAISRLNPKKIKSDSVPVVFDNRVSGGLVSILAGSISGQSISRGTSFLKDKLGRKIFNSNINIFDDPLRLRGHRSRIFDLEGVQTKKIKIVKKGILNSWLLDCRSARQLKLNTTAHAVRNTSTPPSPSPSNIYLDKGKKSKTDLIKSIKKGFYVTEMMGMSFNQVTGDYSRGATGFWIQNGEITFPVSEVTIAGNMHSMFESLIPSSDLKFRTGIDSPTVMIENMTVAGL